MVVVPYGDILRYHAERKPADALALTYPEGELTWWELENRANQRARLLRVLGVRQDDMVTLALGNGLLFHEIVFAIWKCGATPNIISPALPRAELEAILDLAKPRLVIGGAPEDMPGYQHLAPDADTSDFSAAPFPAMTARYWKAMTSGGSTGRPKLIVDRAPAAVAFENNDLSNKYMVQPGMTVLNPGPLYHNGPFLMAHSGLFVGSHVVGLTRFDAEEALRQIEKHRVNFVMMVPTMMARISALPEKVRQSYDMESLQVLWHMAAPCPPALKKSWIDWLGGERIWELYGATEAIGATIIRGDQWLEKRGSVGRPLDPEAMRILDEEGYPCRPGEVGEIYFRTPSAEAMPYHYIGAEAKRDRNGWESFGDLGHLDKDGFLFLADRRTDLILRGGANVYPAEVEAALDTHPDVASSVVIGVPCPDLGHRVHAIVQPEAGESIDIHDLAEFLEERIAKYKRPESFEIVDYPLRDDAGKVRRSALREQRTAWLKSGIEFRRFLQFPTRAQRAV